MSKIKFAPKVMVTALTALLLAGAGAGGAVASAHTAEKSPYLTGTTIHVGNGQNVPTFDLFALYSQDIDRTSVEFGNGTNQITFDGLGTLTNHFDANGEYTGSTYTDDPNVDASGHKKLSTAFGVTNKFVAQAEGASSSRVYTNLTIVLDDMARPTATTPVAPKVDTPNNTELPVAVKAPTVNKATTTTNTPTVLTASGNSEAHVQTVEATNQPASNETVATPTVDAGQATVIAPENATAVADTDIAENATAVADTDIATNSSVAELTVHGQAGAVIDQDNTKSVTVVAKGADIMKARSL